MIRSLSLAAVFATAVALPALAQDNKTQVDPSKGGPTGTMTDQVPPMKDNSATKPGDKSTDPNKAMDSATPAMKPGDPTSGSAGSAATKSNSGLDNAATKPAAAPSPSVSATAGPRIKLNDQEAKAWIGKPIYSSDDKKIGEVLSFQRSSDGQVTELHGGIGGFLGMGETHVRVMPTEFKLQSDRVVLTIPSAQAKDLPKIPTK